MRLTITSFTALVASILFSLHTSSAGAVDPLSFSGYHDQSTSLYTVYQFPNTTWLENLAVRPNGQILLNVLDRPELYQVDPFAHPTTTTATLIHHFDQYAGGLLGIAELEADEFAVVLGNYSVATGTPTPGSFAIWRVDFRRCGPDEAPRVSKIADIPTATMLNGMAALNPRAVLVADSRLGVVFRVDTDTGEHAVVIDDESMKPLPGRLFTVGINGVKVRDGYLYYTNSFSGHLMRVRVDRLTGAAIGPFEVVGPQPWIADDIAVAEDGTTYVTGSITNVVTRVSPDGEADVVAGNPNSSDVAGATAAALGRTAKDRCVLYVSDNGGMAAPVNGSFVEGGKITAVRVGGFGGRGMR